MHRFLNFVVFGCTVLAVTTRPSVADVTLAQAGRSNVVIHVAPDVMADDRVLAQSATFDANESEENRRRLRESVKDLSHYLGRITGARIPVVQGAPKSEAKTLPILIGSYAVQKFGTIRESASYRQGFRIVVSKQAIGLMGESDESTSYAIYELLDQIGCRWFLPGAMGESVPHNPSLSLKESDVSSAPGTLGRRIAWYADDAYWRRNRQGGLRIQAGHLLESYITQQQRREHPEWRAIINGKPDDERLKWSSPGVVEAVADAIIARLDKKYQPCISLSPADGDKFDESDDTAWDAGDWDPSTNSVSITDRYVKFCNLVAQRVNKKYPDVLFGFLAYVQYTRPPVREKPHPNLIPEFAPITYCRAHAMTDTHICPSRAQMRPIIEGWAKVSKRICYYNYMYNLAEPSVPYPMIHQMSEEIPIAYANNVVFWQPESMPSFDTTLPGTWLSTRMSWNPKANPQQVLDEFYSRFYGSVARPMREYWQVMDDAWIKVPEHAGRDAGYLRRFTPLVMAQARSAMNEALNGASTPLEYQRVKFHDQALRQFERLMRLHRDLAEGRLKDINLRATEWLGTQIGLGNEYTDNFSFGRVDFRPQTMPGSLFKVAIYEDAARITRDFSVLSPPLREWKYQVANKQDGVELGWHQVSFNDAAWKTTDVAVDSWSALGLDGYMGAMWYRQQVNVPPVPTGKKVYLWVSKEDGKVSVFVNGQRAPYVDANGVESDEFPGGFQKPISFDITAAVKAGTMNQITIVGTRTAIWELGTGGLLGPVYLYREK